MLSKELEMLRVSSSLNTENLENNKENMVKLERMLKEKDWELQDLCNMKSLKIQELETQLEEHMKNMERLKEDFIRK